METEPSAYAHGHHESVLRSHSSRTIANSAAYLVPYLTPLGPDGRLLDVGCGPGSLTAEMADRIAPGEAIGIDASTRVIEQATADHGDVARFATGDIYELEFPDDHFDIVHAHQVLQHLDDPIRALVEMRRVARPGGVVAIRETDYGVMSWAPANADLDRWMTIYQTMTANNGHTANAGRHLLGWAQQAGFTDVTASSSTWTFADPESRSWWAGVWADRVLESSYRTQALDQGLCDEAELAEISAGWRRWAEQPDGFFMCPHVEIIAVA
jgi:ubiquinone/menaquinone biosynthesis C-methylase UbiE